jgi:hypothetical protein
MLVIPLLVHYHLSAFSGMCSLVGCAFAPLVHFPLFGALVYYLLLACPGLLSLLSEM